MYTHKRSIGTSIRLFRKRAGLSQAGLAEHVGISTNYICLIERDRKSPSLMLLAKIADSLSVNLEELIGRDESIDKIRKILDRSISKEMIKELKELVAKL